MSSFVGSGWSILTGDDWITNNRFSFKTQLKMQIPEIVKYLLDWS